MRRLAVALLAASVTTGFARAETPEEWITLGARVHGAFGAYIPVGIRIGLDALQRLDAKPREVTVLYYDSDKAPCACFADGIALASRPSAPARCGLRRERRRKGRWQSWLFATRRPARR